MKFYQWKTCFIAILVLVPNVFSPSYAFKPASSNELQFDWPTPRPCSQHRRAADAEPDDEWENDGCGLYPVTSANVNPQNPQDGTVTYYGDDTFYSIKCRGFCEAGKHCLFTVEPAGDRTLAGCNCRVY